MKRNLPLILILTACLAAAGCGGPAPKIAEPEIPGYKALQEQFRGRDMTPLHGRRIVLDPGHGGMFKGAVGPGGLTEAEVNLGVALYLRGLLEWSGATVFMTRTADYDFLSARDSTLTSDLAFRSSFADSLQPDVFLSLHHNSVASLDRTVNETQTYYPLNADGASLDLARAIHRHLVLNLEISPAKILPGNFHVLRKATVPAVLGEPAMISHPVIEGRLSLAASQRLEAEAYFLGLLDYFSQGSPAWSGIHSGTQEDTVTVDPDMTATRIEWTFVSEDTLRPPGPGLDPGTIELTLNGRQTPFHVTGPGFTVHWTLADPQLELPAVLELRGRNLLGRATPVRRTVLMPPQAGRVDLHFIAESGDAADGGILAVRWRAAGNTLLPPGRFVFADDRTLPISGGESGTALWPNPAMIPTGARYRPADPDLPDLPCDITSAELPAPWRWRKLVGNGGRQLGPWSSRSWPLEDFPPGVTDQTTPLIPHEPGRPIWITVPGMLPLVDPAPADPDTARTVAAADREWHTEPLAADLLGKVIVLDPAGGGSDTDGTGPLGTRGATLNLETALLAGDLLAGCGAVVHLTRHGETTLGAEDKVRLAGEVGADLFITIGRSGRPDTLTAGHHPGSETGTRWAEIFVQAASGLADSLAVTPSYDYLLRHTACPALAVRLPLPVTPRQEVRLMARGWQRAEARAVLLSVVSLFQPESRLAPTLDVAAVIAGLDGGIRPDEVDWAELDGNLLWSPLPPRNEDQAHRPPSTVAEYSLDSRHGPGLPALGDRHTLEIRAGSKWELWLLEKSDSGFTARPLMRNP
ncbi:MAG: N-acetylmuramoyl-L-alanine amidase [Candidatus Krumholzibacteriota bacterium]